MIEIRNLTKRFGDVLAVDDVTCTVAEGESLALWGSNGAGKTTLIRCVLGVTRFDGEIQVGGVDVRRNGKDARSLIGYVPQELAFHDDTRLKSAMAFFARLRRVGMDDAYRALDSVGLTGHEGKRLRELSGGMKQRLALSIALLADPPVIVLDEPTSNLDESGRRAVVEALEGLHRAGKTLVFASHRQEEVADLADRMLHLENGQVSAITRPGSDNPTRDRTPNVRLHVSGGKGQGES